MEQFWINNIFAKDLLKKQGITFDSGNTMTNLEFLNKGTSAEIFIIKGTNSILKISTNQEEYKASKLLQNHKNVLGSVIQIPLLSIEHAGLYYMVYERLQPIDKQYAKILKSIEYVCNQVNIENLTHLEKYLPKVKTYLDAKGYKFYDTFLDFVVQAHKLLKRYGLSDVHSDNIMMNKKGQFIIIDTQLS